MHVHLLCVADGVHRTLIVRLWSQTMQLCLFLSLSLNSHPANVEVLGWAMFLTVAGFWI